MVYWHGKTLAELDRNQIETIASKAIEELVSINNYKSKRESQDWLILSFAAGIAFTLFACVIGISLHS